MGLFIELCNEIFIHNTDYNSKNNFINYDNDSIYEVE